jgi:hypothetical protein
MGLLNEDISRIKEIMGIDEGPNGPAYKGPEGYDDSCDCYPDDEEVNEGEIDEQEEGGEPAPSGPAMSTWETGLTRGKANPIDDTTKWESGINRGKGNPVW